MRSTRHKRRQRFSVGFICILMMWMLAGQMQVWAKEENESRTESLDEKALQEILGQLDFQETNEQLKELFPEERLDFKETVTELISGDTKATASLLNRMVRSSVLCIPKRKKEFDTDHPSGAHCGSAQSVFECVSKSSDCGNQLLCYVSASVGIVS